MCLAGTFLCMCPRGVSLSVCVFARAITKEYSHDMGVMGISATCRSSSPPRAHSIVSVYVGVLISTAAIVTLFWSDVSSIPRATKSPPVKLCWHMGVLYTPLISHRWTLNFVQCALCGYFCVNARIHASISLLVCVSSTYSCQQELYLYACSGLFCCNVPW